MDRIFRQDVGDYMNDDEYNQYLAKKAAYQKANATDPTITKLAESYKNDMPSDNISFRQPPSPVDLAGMPMNQDKLENVEQGVRNATGFGNNNPKILALRKLLGQ